MSFVPRSTVAFRAPLARLPVARAAARSFHSTPRACINVGDAVPKSSNLYEDSPGHKVDLAMELGKSNGYIIGVPGAFSGTCSSKHIPSWINHLKIKEAGTVFVVSVNDPFVMKAWSQQLDPEGKSGIRFIADPSGGFTKALDLVFEGGRTVFGNDRSKRYALEIKNKRIHKMFVEPDDTGADVSMAENVLSK